MQASTPRECKKIILFDLSRPNITIVIWSITAGTKPSRSGSQVSRAKNVNRVISGPLTIHVTIVSRRLQLVKMRSSFLVYILGCSRSTVTIVIQHLEPVTKLHSSSLKSGVLTISRHDREHASRARDQQVSSGLHSFSNSGTLTIRVTIVNLPSQLVTFKSFISNEVWDAHDLMSRSWACNLSSWPYFA